ALTEEALDHAALRCGGISGEARTKLLSAYATLEAFPDVVPTLGALKARGARLVILSNGSPAMLESAVRSAGLADLLDPSISVEEAGVFKTDSRVYALVSARYGLGPQDVFFQSSNRWDIAGAVKFGFRANWINRAGAADEYAEFRPASVLNGLAGLLDLQAGRNLEPSS
ncbi:MAG: haloacid dehalogenase type II, partial [Rhodoblastus sp.]